MGRLAFIVKRILNHSWFLLELTREEHCCSSQLSFDDVEIFSEELERINDFFNELSTTSN